MVDCSISHEGDCATAYINNVGDIIYLLPCAEVPSDLIFLRVQTHYVPKDYDENTLKNIIMPKAEISGASIQLY